MKIYHGSNVVVEHPDVRVRGFEKDFGYGFYCTAMELQAKKWALTKKNCHIVNVYEMMEVDDDCRVLKFGDMSEDWLDFVVSCRRGVPHSYDIVEGPMADDQIWNYIEDFVSGDISRSAFWELVKFRHPTHQVVFCSQKALCHIQYIKSYSL